MGDSRQKNYWRQNKEARKEFGDSINEDRAIDPDSCPSRWTHNTRSYLRQPVVVSSSMRSPKNTYAHLTFP